MENLEYEVGKYKIGIEDVTLLPTGDFFVDVYIDRKKGRGFFLKDLKIEYNSFQDFFNCINNNLFEKYKISFIDKAKPYFRRAYGYCKQIIKQGLKQ